jgi:ubiquinone/menaquinone biosynthesis C-methylase UbiE
MAKDELRRIASNTREVYEKNATRFDAERDKSLIERAWLDRFCALLPPGARVLDAGCGTGDPIARELIVRGCRVTGVDFAAAMLDIARARHPGACWVQADMRDLALGATFNGIIAWHSFFHLTPEEQKRALARLAAHLGAEGVMMLTVGPEVGEVLGHVGDDVIYHASLTREEYERLLGDAGVMVVEFVADDKNCGGATVLLARRAAASP